MTPTLPTHGLQLRTTITAKGTLELTLVDEPVRPPADDDVLVRIDAAPINPSDIGLLFGAADMGTATSTGTPARPALTATVPAKAMPGMAARLDASMPAGNEGAGLVVAAGAASAAQALLGKTVAIISGATYGQYRTVKASTCLQLPEGATATQGASSFVNPLTALGMVETMRREGHHALVHTAAASNLGQMLNKICLKDGIALVNIVRKPEQRRVLEAIGATHICDQSSPTFKADLTDALVATGATLAFDATGGGKLAGQILGCMEAALNRTATAYSRYGSSTHKQVYLYGGLDTSPTEFSRNFGMAWGMGGWLVFPYLAKIGAAREAALKARVAAELTTTFASHYTREITLAEMLQPEVAQAYDARATGAKFLVTPNRGL